MDETEKVFADGLRKAASGRPAIAVDVDEVIARGEAAGRTPVRRPSWRWLAVAAAVLLVAGVGVWFVNRPGAVPAVPVASPQALVLTGTRWLATEIGGTPVQPTSDGEVPWLEFSAARMSGGDPCNGVGRTYSLDGDRLSFGDPGFSTLIGCNADQQQRFVAALDATRRAQLSGDVLEFLDASGTVVLRFRGEPSTGSPTPTTSATFPHSTPVPGTVTSADQLTGNVWQAVELRGVEVYDGRGVTPTLQFLRSGVVEGSDPCNRGQGRYRLADGGLVISDWASDAMDCGTSAQQQFHDVLAATASARADADRLLLFDASGAMVARFLAAPQSGDVVQVRVRNDSGFDVTGVKLGIRNGTATDWVDFGSLAAGAVSDYVDVGDQLYDSLSASATVDGRTLVLVPTDLAGHPTLGPGTYTYVLSLTGAGDLRLTRE